MRSNETLCDITDFGGPVLCSWASSQTFEPAEFCYGVNCGTEIPKLPRSYCVQHLEKALFKKPSAFAIMGEIFYGQTYLRRFMLVLRENSDQRRWTGLGKASADCLMPLWRDGGLPWCPPVIQLGAGCHRTQRPGTRLPWTQ